MKRFFTTVKAMVSSVLASTKKKAIEFAAFLKSFFKTMKEDAPVAEEKGSSTNTSSVMTDMVAAKNAEAAKRAKDFDPHAKPEKKRKTRPLRKNNRKPRK